MIARAVLGAILGATLLWPARLGAQEFVPPEEDATSGPFRFNLFGFASRAGIDFTNGVRPVLSLALDAGDVYTSRLRLRPSVEIELADTTTYVGSLEMLLRFTGDREVAVPYLGGGLAVWGQQRCSAVPDCPGIWLQAVIGFELHLKDRINWLVEYHAEDAFDRHRFFIGLTTRRGS